MKKMGFWDTIKKVGGNLLNEAKEWNEIRNSYKDFPNETLEEVLKSSKITSRERAVIKGLLNERKKR